MESVAVTTAVDCSSLLHLIHKHIPCNLKKKKPKNLGNKKVKKINENELWDGFGGGSDWGMISKSIKPSININLHKKNLLKKRITNPLEKGNKNQEYIIKTPHWTRCFGRIGWRAGDRGRERPPSSPGRTWSFRSSGGSRSPTMIAALPCLNSLLVNF